MALFNRGLTRACLKHCGTIPDDKVLFTILVTMGIILSKQSQRTGVGMGSRSQDILAFPGVRFLKSLQLQVETLQRLCQRIQQGLVGIGLSGSKMLLISSILCTSWEIFEGRLVSPNLSII